MGTTTKKTEELSDQIQITINGRPRTLTMTFGHLNLLTQVTDDLDELLQGFMNPKLRGEVFHIMLDERDDDGAVTKSVNVEFLNIERDDAVALYTWAMEHVLDFFLKSAAQTKGTLEKFDSKIQEIVPQTSFPDG